MFKFGFNLPGKIGAAGRSDWSVDHDSGLCRGQCCHAVLQSMGHSLWHGPLTGVCLVDHFHVRILVTSQCRSSRVQPWALSSLAMWAEIGYVFRVPTFPSKTGGSFLYNCGFNPVSQLTFHFFFRLLGTFTFRSIK